MDKPKFTIADDEFLPYGKSESLGGDNSTVSPTFFDWEHADSEIARFVTNRHFGDARGEGQIAWVLESFFLHPENYLNAMKKPFDAVLTHNRYFAENMGWTWVPHGGSWIDFNLWGMHEKTKNVSIVLSNKNSMPGQKLRHKVVRKYGDKIDVFGMENYVRKFDCLAPYCYSIVIEAERCPGFFSEHLIDCLSVGTIPIYWGDPGIGNIFKGGYWMCEDFQDIGYSIDNSNDDYYEMSIKVVKENIEIAKQYRICEDWIFIHHPELFGMQA